MGEGCRGIGGADESEGSIVGGIFEGEASVSKGREPVGHSVVDVTIDIGVSNEAMDHFSATHQITISIQFHQTTVCEYRLSYKSKLFDKITTSPLHFLPVDSSHHKVLLLPFVYIC